MDKEFKDVAIAALKNNEDLERKMNLCFPGNRWVCQIETKSRPYL